MSPPRQARALEDALAAALVERSQASGGPVAVGHDDDPVAVALARTSGRFVAASGPAARALIGRGVAAAGRPAVVVAGAGVISPVDPDGRVTVVVRDARAAERLRLAGWTALHPVWPDDVPRCLDAALASDEPVVLRLHARNLPDGEAPPPELGTPRILAEGDTGVVVAAGARVADVLAGRRALRTRGLDLAVVDVHTRRPPAGAALAEPDAAVLVGGPQAAYDLARGRLRVGALRAVVVPGGADLPALLGEHVPLHG